MIGSVQVTGASAPYRLREDQNENEEEQADNFEEHDVSHSAERLEEPADSSGEAPHGVARGAPGASARASSDHAFNSHRPGNGAAGGGRASDDPLPGHASHQAHPNSQHAANGLRFHTRL